MSSIRRRTTVEPFGPAAAIHLTDADLAELGATTKVPPVTVTVGTTTVPGRVSRMGGTCCIGLRRESREALGVQIGDEVDVVIALDTAERTVDVPTELADALAAAGLREAFDGWSYTRRKEAAVAVTGAKRDDTRRRRLEKILAELS